MEWWLHDFYREMKETRFLIFSSYYKSPLVKLPPTGRNNYYHGYILSGRRLNSTSMKRMAVRYSNANNEL